jgi:hypothetical protein
MQHIYSQIYQIYKKNNELNEKLQLLAQEGTAPPKLVTAVDKSNEETAAAKVVHTALENIYDLTVMNILLAEIAKEEGNAPEHGTAYLDILKSMTYSIECYATLPQSYRDASGTRKGRMRKAA